MRKGALSNIANMSYSNQALDLDSGSKWQGEYNVKQISSDRLATLIVLDDLSRLETSEVSAYLRFIRAAGKINEVADCIKVLFPHRIPDDDDGFRTEAPQDLDPYASSVFRAIVMEAGYTPRSDFKNRYERLEPFNFVSSFDSSWNL